MKKIKLIKFTDTDSNYRLMYKWCSQEYIYTWFEQRILSYKEIVEKYKNKLLSNKQQLYIIKYQEELIGYVQIYKYDDIIYEEIENYNNIYEFDIFIGEIKYLSKGIGSKTINLVNEYIFKNNNGDCILLRPFKSNKKAINCYQNNGFKIINEYIGKDSLGNKEPIITLIKERINDDKWQL